MLPRALARRLSISLVLGVAVLTAIGSAGTDASSSVPAAVRTHGLLTGIDVSHWQGRINWPRVQRAGVRFVIAKATDGLSGADGRYHRNARMARRAGLMFTAYHFARPAGGVANAQAQADFFVARAKLQSSDLVPALDLETTGGLGHVALERWVLAFLNRVQHRLGVKPMVYTSPGFWTGAMANTRAIVRAGYRVLWVAHWDTAHPSVPAKRWNGNGWTIWQWTKCGRIAGIRTCVDRDAISGVVLKTLTLAVQRGH